MIRSVTKFFPKDWRQTVTVRRFTRNAMGDTKNETIPPIEDCVFVPSYSIYTDTRRWEIAKTGRKLYCPVGTDIRSGDEVTIPANTWHKQVVATVEGDPECTPLGVSCSLTEDKTEKVGAQPWVQPRM